LDQNELYQYSIGASVMKKRKPPIIAITLLILFGAVTFALNYYSGIDPKVEAQNAAKRSADASVGTPRPTADTKSTAASVQAQMGAGGKGAPGTTPKMPGPHGMPGGMPGGAGGNPLEVPKYANTKPVPNESAVSSGWYYKDAKPAGGG